VATAIVYMESSAVVAALLEHDRAAMEPVSGHVRRVTSALTLAETARAIVRARVTGRLTADQERAAVRALKTFSRRCFVLDVDSGVLSRAGRRFPVEPIRTLDALHLATAELLDDSPQLVTIVTRDARVRENALAMGFATA
jgi:predicted nucleic acid-binding protein